MYVLMKNDEIIDIDVNPMAADGCICREATEEEYLDFKQKKERMQKDLLFLTASDVERAIYKDKGVDFEDIISMLDSYPEIDKKAVRIELKANNFYRGNPYVNQIGTILGYSAEQLDNLFINGGFD